MKKIELSKDVYSVENIKKTIGIYKGYADIILKQNHRYAVLTFKRCKYEEERTVKEFENYLIGLV